MKSFFTKLGGLLLCGVMFTAVGCHDYAEDIKDVNDRLDKIDGVLSGDSEGVAKDLAALKATVAALDATYATEAELEKAVGDLQTALEGKVSAAVKEANDAVAALQAAVAEKADKSELTAKETELLAKINELKSDMDDAKSEMQNALAGLDKKYVALATYNAAISEINATLEGLDEIYFTKEAFNTAKTNFDNAVKVIKDDIDAVEESIETLDETLKSKVGIEEVNAAVETAVKVVADKVATLETTVGEVNTKLGELETSIKENAAAIAEVKGNLATEVRELEAAIALKANKTAVDSLSTALDNLETELKGLVAAKADTTALNNLESTLSALINEKAAQSALEEVEDAVETLQGTVDDLATSNAEAHKALQAYAEEVKKAMSGEIDNLSKNLGDLDWRLQELEKAFAELAGKSKVSEAEIAQLFARIQSVVFRPEYADGKAHVSYAMAGNTTLEGYSYVTYKVFPASCAETIKAAINQKEGTPALTVSFDAFKAKSSNTEFIDVISADADADGCLTIKYKANFGADFYSDDEGYNAALVLAETREDNPQNFSTEYTNFVADASLAKTYQMELYLDGEKFERGDADTSWMFVEAGKAFAKDVLANLEPRFQEVGVQGPTAPEALNADAFEALGYDATCETVTTAEHNDIISVGIDPDNNVKACLVEEANIANVGQTTTVTKTVTWVGGGNQSADAVANLSVVEFEYAFVLDGAKSKNYYIPYVNKSKSVQVLADVMMPCFVNSEKDTLTVEEMAEKYPVVVTNCETKLGNTVSLFEVTSDNETYSFPSSVSLKDEVDVDDVGSSLYLTYNFSIPVLQVADVTASGFVLIDAPTYNYTLDDITINWAYNPDAKSDADKSIPYSRKVEGVNVNAPEVADGSQFSTIWNSNNNIEYTVDGQSSTDIVISPIEGDNSKVNVEFSSFAWGKTYPVTVRVEVINANGKHAETVNVKFNIKTVDRNREPVTYTAEEAVKFNFAKDVTVTSEQACSLAGLYADLVEGKNLDAEANAEAEYLKDVKVVSDAVKFNDKEITFIGGGAPAMILMDADLLAANSYKVVYNAATGAIMPLQKVYTVVKTLMTWYGQEIKLMQDVVLVDPVYDFSPVPQYLKGEENAYYIDVLPQYTYDAKNIMTGFSTEAVNLDRAFDVIDADKKVLSDEDMAKLGLNREFKLINNTDENIKLSTNADGDVVLQYNGKAKAVNVNGSLYILNTNNTKFPIDETIFTGSFKSFEVRMFDPLAETMTVLDGKADQNIQITEAKKYHFAVLDNYSLKDVLGNELINSANVDDAKNDFLHNYATPEVYGLTPTYTMHAYIKDKEVALPTGISFADGIITVDNTAQIQFANPVVIKVTATITYPQGERVGQTVTYTFN